MLFRFGGMRFLFFLVALLGTVIPVRAQSIVVPEVFNNLGPRNSDGSFNLGTYFVNNTANWSYTVGSSAPSSAYDRVSIFSTYSNNTTFTIPSDAMGGRILKEFSLTLGATAGGVNQDLSSFGGALVFGNRNTGQYDYIPLSASHLTLSAAPVGSTIGIGSTSGLSQNLYLATFSNVSLRSEFYYSALDGLHPSISTTRKFCLFS